jgi:hypothetical protein
VVGEGTRCWFGNQFPLTAPKFAAYGVELWVPELGGRFDARNPSHKMLMSVLGGMSESERQHVQARVRAAMDAQVLNEGRHQGGRARRTGTSSSTAARTRTRARLRRASDSGSWRSLSISDVSMRFEPAEQAIYVTARPRVDSARVRGGTRSHVRRTPATGRGSCAQRYSWRPPPASSMPTRDSEQMRPVMVWQFLRVAPINNEVGAHACHGWSAAV